MAGTKEERAHEIECFAKRLGADLVGFADLRKLRGIFTYPEDMIEESPYGISIAVGLDKHGKYCNASEDDFAFPLLDKIAHELKRHIESKGYSAKVIAADKRVAPNSILYWRGEISHKAVAKTAGIGWIGRSTLLVTPALGPRVCLATVVTDMPLAAGRTMENRCGKCRICISACPLDALKHSLFEEHPRKIEDAIDVVKCGSFVNKTWRNLELCYECMLACPKGVRVAKKREAAGRGT